MKRTRKWLAALLLALASPAFADVVLDWNEVGASAIIGRIGPPEGARVMAMMHVAMYNAINAVEGRRASYLFEARPKGEASAEAAGAASARTVLEAMIPQQKESFEKAYQASLQKLAGR